MKRFFLFSIIALLFITSCDDNTDTLGGSLTDITDNIESYAKEFNVETDTWQADSICARSAFAYLGKMQDTETGSYITANYMTQLRLQPYYVPFYGIDSLIVLNENKDTLKYGKTLTEAERNEKIWQVKADSCHLTLYVSSFTGDSTAQMKLAAHEMKKPYDESEEYSISYDPRKYDYLRDEKGSIHAQLSYAIKNNTTTGSTGTTHYITIPLNQPYTNKIREDKDSTFNNFGSYLMYQYYNENAIYHKGFKSPYNFMHYLCPGFYLEHISGMGAISSITATTLSISYKTQNLDKNIPFVSECLISGTEESIQHSTITENNFLSTLTEAEKNAYTYVKSPAGIYTRMKFDVMGIMEGHDKDSLSTARIFLPCLNKVNTSDYVQSPPANLLMVQADSIYTFFDNKKLADYRTTFLASYSSGTNGYTFNNISTLIIKMYLDWKESGMSIEEYTSKYPNWNVVSLVPVETSYSSIGTSSILSKVSHSMTLESTRLPRGTKENGTIKMGVIYSKYED